MAGGELRYYRARQSYAGNRCRAKAEIYELLSELAEQGRAVVVLSAEYAEIARLCDRTYVMYHGRIVGELERTDLSEEAVMMYSTGLKSDARPQP